MVHLKYNTVKINITTRNINHFKKKGYDVKIGDNVEVKINDLSKNSHIKIIAICECGQEKELRYHKYLENINRYGYYSCKKCSGNKKRETYLKNYGVDNPMKDPNIKIKVEKTNMEKYGFKNIFLSDNFRDKIKQINLNKYGVDEILKSQEIQEKRKNTMLKNHGVVYPTQNDNLYQKIKQTNLNKYGFEYAAQNDIIKNKTKYTNLERYGHVSPIKSDIVKNKINKKYIDYYQNIGFNILKITDQNKLIIKCDKCNNDFEISKSLFNHKFSNNIELCPICHPKTKSNNEKLMLKFITDNYTGKILINKKNIISPFELDVYLPDLKIAFEYNGIYWHNELHKNNDYHINKTEMCEKLGIELIHIWEDDWIYKQTIVKCNILNKLGDNKSYPIDYEIKELSNDIVKEFLILNNIYGYIKSSIKIGLYNNDELVSLMTFEKIKNKYKIITFCNKLNTNSFDSASKIFEYFIKKYNPSEISIYSDRCYLNNFYNGLGFKFIKKIQPNYFYVINDKRYNKYKYQKINLIKQGFDPNKTEHEIMLERKIYRIYDSGYLLFKWDNF